MSGYLDLPEGYGVLPGELGPLKKSSSIPSSTQGSSMGPLLRRFQE